MFKTDMKHLTGVAKTFYHDYLITVAITAIIAFSIQGIYFARAIWSATTGHGETMNSGMINVFFFTSVIAMLVMMIATTSMTEMRGRFAFPINKNVYFVGTGLMIVYGVLIMTAVGVIAVFVEVLALRIAALLIPTFIPLTRIDMNTYLLGFFANFGYLILLSVCYYTFFMYVRKWPIPTLIVGAFLLAMVLNVNINPVGQSVITIKMETISFVWPMVQVALLSIVIYMISYFPLKKMEVL